MTDENPYAAPKADLTVAASEELASRMARLGGALVDGLIAMAIIWPSMYFLGIFTRAIEDAATIQDTVISGVIGLASFFAVNGYLLANYGQTVGKRIANTRIVSIEDGKILPFWKLVMLRYAPLWAVSYVPFVGPLLNLINPLFIFRNDRRCAHDHIAGTKVINAK